MLKSLCDMYETQCILPITLGCAPGLDGLVLGRPICEKLDLTDMVIT